MRVPFSAARRAPGRPARRGRRLRRALVAALVLAVVVGVESIPGVPGHRQAALLGDLAASDGSAVATWALPFLDGRPSQPCARLESRFEVGNHLLRGDAVGWYASIWPSFQALSALYVASMVDPGRGSCRQSFEENVAAIDAGYWDTSYRGMPAAFDQGPHAFHFHSDLPRVDDSLWMGLAVMRAYLMTRNPAYLRRAEAVFRLAVGNWDPKKGGVYWEYHAAGATDYDKSVVSNAPAVVLGAALYSVTRTPSYLTWSGRILQWVEAHLVDPRTGLYDDHIDTHARRVRIGSAQFTYNQGIMVGAMAALATVDPTRYRLDAAVGLADRSMAYFRAHRSYGQAAFDAIWAHNLLWTASLARSATFTRKARSSLDLALRAEPAGPAGLLAEGSEAALHELARLPTGDYPRLSYLR